MRLISGTYWTFPQIYSLKKIPKIWFWRWKSTNNNDINIFLSLENPCTFLLTKEKTWRRIVFTNSNLSQNRTEKQIMPSQTTINWLFNDIWCYLFFACFDWKIGVFQQNNCKGLLYPQSKSIEQFEWLVSKYLPVQNQQQKN